MVKLPEFFIKEGTLPYIAGLNTIKKSSLTGYRGIGLQRPLGISSPARKSCLPLARIGNLMVTCPVREFQWAFDGQLSQKFR